MDSETQKIRIMHAMTFAEKNLRQAWNAIQTGDLHELHLRLENAQLEVTHAFDLINRTAERNQDASTKCHDVEEDV